MPTILDAIGIDVPERVDGVEQQTVDGDSLLPDLRRRRRARRRATRSTSRCSAAGDLPRRVEGDDRPRRQAAHRRAELLEGSHDFDDDHWALFDLRRRLLRVDRRRRRAPRPGRAAGGALVGRGRAQPGAAARRLVPRPGGRDGARPERAPAPHHLPARRRRRRRGHAPADRRRLPAHRRRGRARSGGAAGRDVRARRLDQRLGLVPARRAAGHARSTCSATPPGWPRTEPVGPGDHELGAHLRGRHAHAARRRRAVAPSRCPATCRSAGRSAAASCWSAATPASRCATTTRRRSPAPPTCARSPSRSRCSPPTTPSSRSPPPSAASSPARPFRD